MDLINKIICDDCLNILKEIPDESIDLIVTDPPYNVSNKGKFEIKEKQYKRICEEWDVFTKEEYLKFTIQWLKECNRVLKNGGAIYVTGAFHNIFDTFIIMRDEINFTFRNFITWFKPNAMPIKFAKNIGCFAYSCEYICYFSKGKVKTFNYDLLKEINGGKQMRDIIQLSISQNKKIKHPSKKPLELIELFIKASSNEGDVVLDPFIGSGTTAVACKKLNRNYIGIEKNENYYQIANERIENFDCN